MKLQKPKVLFVFGARRSDTTTLFGGFVRRLEKQGGLGKVDAHYAALEDLVFEIKDNQAVIRDVRTGLFIDDFDWVYFKSWISYADTAASLAVYLQTNGIPFADHAVLLKGSSASKLYSNMEFWAKDIRIPDTLYADQKHLKEALENSSLDYPYVLKDVRGQKGRNNYLVTSKVELENILESHEGVQFIAQAFIPNTHDYRVQVYGGKAALIMKRMPSSGSHLNNTSAGGGAVLEEVSSADKELCRIAEKAAAAVDLQVSGVDVLPHKETGEYFVLEANQGSQIVTGKFTEENMAAFNKYVTSQAKTRIRKSTTQPKLGVVGRHEIVDLPEFGILGAEAKVDTGAYRSSLHAENIREVEENGKPVLKFSLPTVVKRRGDVGKFKEFTVEDYDVSHVRKSTTIIEDRYIIKTSLRISGRLFTTTFTLTDRASMRFPVLIGRKVLRSRFMVNPELSHYEEKS